ncbi:MAG: phosphoribosyl-AMP cyclohydrolase [Desulfobulbaceae bacterium]|nr:phosphoribosyl-AMP cyclohydrolase [Desulfobulbaceae bacterium]
MKYSEKLKEGSVCCRHPDDYCKYRTSCIVNFFEQENKRSSRLPAANNDNKIQNNSPVPMIELDFSKTESGLLPAIVQDYSSGEVLMLAYINSIAWEKTLETGKCHYWSRSRNTLWLKGESSGHVQLVREILVDCDEDTVIFKVEQLGGAACHKGYGSCFFRRVEGDRLVVCGEKIFDPQKVYGK